MYMCIYLQYICIYIYMYVQYNSKKKLSPAPSPAASPPPPITRRFLLLRPFDVFLNNLYLLSCQSRGVHVRCRFPAEGPPSPPSPPSPPPASLNPLFYLISLGFWLMSVTATGNKMLVRVCAVASQRRLWYAVRPSAAVSWLLCHRVHVYWLGVNKARPRALAPPSPPLQKVKLPLMRLPYVVRKHKRTCRDVGSAPSLPLFSGAVGAVGCVHAWSVSVE